MTHLVLAFFFILASTSAAGAVPYNSFGDWCRALPSLGVGQKNTVLEMVRASAGNSRPPNASALLASEQERQSLCASVEKELDGKSDIDFAIEPKLPYDFVPLASLRHLTGLKMTCMTGRDEPVDLGFVANLRNLGSLTLDHDEASDTHQCQYLNLGAIQFLPRLREVEVNQSTLRDLSPFATMIGLTWLRLDQNQITDINALMSLVNLKFLSVARNNLSQVWAVRYMTNLETLDIGGNQVDDLSPVIDLVWLDRVMLIGNRIVDITPLTKLKNLVFVWLNGNRVRDSAAVIEVLKNNKITAINLCFNPIDFPERIYEEVQNGGGLAHAVIKEEDCKGDGAIRKYHIE